VLFTAAVILVFAWTTTVSRDLTSRVGGTMTTSTPGTH